MLITPAMNNECSRSVAVQYCGGNSPDSYGETWVNVCMLALTDWLARRADLVQERTRTVAQAPCSVTMGERGGVRRGTVHIRVYTIT